MGASSYRLLDAANSNMVGDLIQHNARRLEEKLRNRGGFQAAFPLYQMNRRKQKTRQKNQTESKTQKRNERKLSNEKDEKSMCSVTRSVVRFPAYLSVRPGQQQQRALADHCRQYHRFP